MRKILNIGVIANDGTGDKLRHAFDLSQQNFVELYSFFGDGENITSLSVRQKLDTPTNAEVNQKISTAINPAFVHIESTSNPHGVTKAQVGLPNVDNTSDANKPISTKAQTALDLKADKTALDLKADKTALDLKADKASKGAANGIASLDLNKKVPVLELPTASTAQQGIVQLVNDLTSTDPGKALSAGMGRKLDDRAFTGASNTNLAGARLQGVNYTNSTERTIHVEVTCITPSGGSTIVLGYINGVAKIRQTCNAYTWATVGLLVPSGGTFMLSTESGALSIQSWYEG